MLLLLLTCAPALAALQPPPPAVAEETLQRIVTLAELGFEKGAEFTSFGGQRDFFFPVPRNGLKDATLRLKLRTGTAIGGRRHLQVLAGEHIIFTQPLGSEDTEQTVTLHIDPQLAKDGLLQIALRYSGAFTQDRCVDQRVAGDFVTVLPATALEMQLAPEAYRDIRSFISLMPHDVSIVLPARTLKADEIAAALRIASVLKRQHFAVTFGPAEAAPPPPAGKIWSRGVVMIGQPQDFPATLSNASAAVNGISLAEARHGPALLVSGRDPSPAISLLTSRWQMLAGRATLTVNELAENAPPRQDLTLADLGIGLMSADLVDQVRFDAGFTSEGLPPGHRISAMRLDLALGVAPNDANATISAFVNGRLLGSRTSPGAVPATLSVSVPDGLISRDNVLSVRVQRQPHTGDCMNPPQGYAVQLLPSSSVEISATGSLFADFFALGSVFRNGVDVFLPADPAALTEAMTLFAATTADLLPDAAPINVRIGTPEAAPDKPFVVISRTAPPATNPPLRFDNGRMTINREDGKVLLDLATGDAPAIAQVVSTATAIGIWLRPGSTAPGKNARPVRLDRGNVAVIDDTGVALAFSSGRSQLVAITYVDIRSWADLAREYRPWIVGAAWLTLSIVFIALLSRTFRRHRKE